jgi:peptide/nickel transport system ATP-binding protein
VSVIEVTDLRVELSATGEEIIGGVSFSVERGEVLGLVGESGSGKTTAAVALLGHARRGTRVAGGRVVVAGTSIFDLSPGELRRARGTLMAYVPQDPASALNPALRIGLQLRELLSAHTTLPGNQAETRIGETLRETRLPADESFLRRYPHQLSGGQQQRVCLAMAFLLRPRAIVLDEPTTGLDVTTQAHVLETVRELCRSHDTAALYVSHDLAVVAGLATRVAVLYAGALVEEGPTARIFARPGHPYTRKLMAAIPDVAERRRLEAIPGQVPPPGRRPAGCVFAPRCDHAIAACSAAAPEARPLEPGHLVRCLRMDELEWAVPIALLQREPIDAAAQPLLEVRALDAFHGDQPVLRSISLALNRTECLALVGESGSGKTTLARAIVGLHERRTGEIVYGGHLLERSARRRPAEVCRSLQYIFQSPHTALNPRRSVDATLRAPLEHFFGLRGAEANARVAELLERVSLPPQTAARYPGDLSGGERQRVAIARALGARPDVLICDEITSALDASVQAAIVDLLEELRQQEHVALIFVTHDLALVRTIADRVAVLEQGRITEVGTVDQVLDRPADSYTRQLIADTPALASISP